MSEVLESDKDSERRTVHKTLGKEKLTEWVLEQDASKSVEKEDKENGFNQLLKLQSL